MSTNKFWIDGLKNVEPFSERNHDFFHTPSVAVGYIPMKRMFRNIEHMWKNWILWKILISCISKMKYLLNNVYITNLVIFLIITYHLIINANLKCYVKATDLSWKNLKSLKLKNVL